MIVRRTALLVSLSWPMALVAQQASITTGGGVARVHQLTSGPIGTIGADANLGVGPVALRFAGSTINHQNLGSTNRLRGDLLLSARADDWTFAAGPVFEMASGVRDAWNSAWSGNLRVERAIGRFHLALSAAEGVTHPNAQRVTFARRGARAGADIGPVTVEGLYDVTVTRDSVLRDDVYFDPEQPVLLEGSSPFRTRVRHFEDWAMRMAVATTGFDVRATFGWRSGDDIVAQTWWRLEVTLPVAESASLLLATARQAADPVLVQRGSQAMTLGLRLALPENGNRVDRMPRVDVARESATLVKVTFELPGGDRARIMGEMTGWRAVQLEPLGRGRFAGWFLAPGGIYRINVSLDDGPWIAPPGLPQIEDGFGGLVGLLQL